MNKYGLTYQKKRDLIAAFDRLRTTEGINMNLIPRSSLVELVMNEPAPRFYLEARTIEDLIYMHVRGIRTRMPDRTRDIYEVYCKLREQYPDAKMSDICDRVSRHPAKSFYISKRTARDFIYGWR